MAAYYWQANQKERDMKRLSIALLTAALGISLAATVQEKKPVNKM